MARTPDLAGALEAVVARTLKSVLGSRLRKLDSKLRRLERRMRKSAARPGRPGRRRVRRIVTRGRGRRAARGRRRSK
jgi:hypothetical protein